MYTTLLKSWVGVLFFTIPLSGRLVYKTRSETLLKVDFIAKPVLLSFHPYKEGGGRLYIFVCKKQQNLPSSYTFITYLSYKTNSKLIKIVTYLIRLLIYLIFCFVLLLDTLSL